MKRRLIALFVSLALGMASASAGVLPRPGDGDPRLQTVDYDAQQVVTLKVALGYALTLELAPDERIENVSVGNSAVWQVTPNKSADHLFVKPMQGASETDMTVITDARSYSFDLQPLSTPDGTTAYVIRFLYPVAATQTEPQALPERSFYRFTGSKALHPQDMSDNGQTTSILWPAKSPIPAIYVVDAEGREGLVNGGLRNGRYVIDQVANEFIFRLDNQEMLATRHISRVRSR